MINMTKHPLFLLFGLVCYASNLTGTLSLELHQLPTPPIAENHPIRAMDQQIVTVRGFWYPLNEHEGILAAQPNLRSCCVGSSDKIYKQIVVKDAPCQFPPNQIVTLQGLFQINPGYDEHNNLIQFYILLHK
jgi:hypothetical protein